MLSDVNTTTHGKWILVGEHAVLRQHPAIVFPLRAKQLNLRFIAGGNECKAHFSGSENEIMHLLFWGLLEHGLRLVNRSINDVKGEFYIENHVPIALGLGASAALCAALAEWFCLQEFKERKNFFYFAKELEDLFHGQSSGIDILGATTEQGYFFETPERFTPLKSTWKPHWSLSFSGQLGITANCIKKVNTLRQDNAALADRIDHDMHTAVIQAKDALELPQDQGLPLLADSINKAKICFSQWGLTGGKVEQHINYLLEKGALAAKPTGSGDGGMVLSLWENAPPSSLDMVFIPA